MRKAYLVLLLLLLTTPVLAVGKTTTDPNKGGTVAESAPADLNSDPKLAHKVTYSATKKMVSQILDDLAKSTGVALKAGRNSEDWQVRDRKMSVFAKDVPLAELMSSISRVMKFKWEIGGKSPDWSYRLFMDRRTLLDAEAQRSREEQKAQDEAAKRRQDGLAKYAKLGNLTPADKAKLKTDNPFLYMITNSGMGGSMGAFFSESPAAGEALASGQEMTMSGSALTPAGQAGLIGAMKQMNALENKFGGKSKPLPADIGSQMNHVSISINHNLNMMQGMPGANMLLGEMSVSYNGGSVDVPFLDPDSSMTKFIGKAMMQSDEQNRPIQDVMKDLMPEFMASMVKDFKTDAGGEPVNEHPDDPALHNKVTLKSKSQKLADVEEALADASKLTVVSDYFGSMFMGMGMGASGSVPSTETELKTVLEKIGDAYTYNWDKHSGVIELRDRNWFKKRAAQIPEAWLEKWRQELTKTGTCDIDSLAQIAGLTQEQLSQNVMSDDVLRSLVGTIYGNREILRVYGDLTSDQRSAMFSDTGLDIRTLSQDQWTQADKTIRARGGAKLLDSRKSVFLTAKKDTGTNKSISYQFWLSNGDKTNDITWNFQTPTYTPPPTPPAAPAKPADPTKPADAKPADAKPADAATPVPAK